MISFRHHLVSIVSVFLALAVGVVLGGGPLTDLGRGPRVATTAGEPRTGASFGEAYAAASAQAVLGGRLDKNGVALVTLPGADQEVVDALRSRVEQAGGRVLTSYAVREALLEPGEKALVDTLGSQLMTQYAGGEVDAEASTYDRLGQLLALAVTSTDRAGAPVDARAGSLLDSLDGAELVAAEDEPVRRPPLVLVVHGEEPAGGEEGAAAADAILTGLVAGLGEGAAGVVLTADAASGVDGQLARVREEQALDKVTTVDGADTVTGQVTTVLALGRALAGTPGDFGASGADGAVPLG